jgi:hypothetical protein
MFHCFHIMNCRPRKDSDAEMEIYINEDDELLKDHDKTEVSTNSVKIAILEIVVLLAVIIYIFLIPPSGV